MSPLDVGNVSDLAVDSAMVKNMSVTVGASAISLFVPEIHCTSGLLSAILNYRHRLTATNVVSITPRSHMIENVRVPAEFSLVTLVSNIVLHLTTFRHIGGHLGFQKCHVTNRKLPFCEHINTTPNTFYRASISLIVSELHDVKCSGG
jgi:hypothetical protein